MKKLLLIFCAVLMCLFGNVYAQCVPFNDPNYVSGPTLTFADANLEAALVAADTNNGIANSVKVDFNNNGTIEECELKNLTHLNLSPSILSPFNIGSIQSLDGLQNSILSVLNLANITTLTNNELNFNHFPETLVFIGAADCNLSALTNMDTSPILNRSDVTITPRITGNPNLQFIDLTGYNLSYLSQGADFSNNGLTQIILNPIPPNLDVSTHAVGISLKGNTLSSIDLSGVKPYLYLLDLSENNFSGSIDLNDATFLQFLDLELNDFNTIFIKNGQDEFDLHSIPIQIPSLIGNANLQYVCADASQVNAISNSLTTNTVVNTFCNFNPGGITHEVMGISEFDFNSNNCTSGTTPVYNLSFGVDNGTTTTDVYNPSNTNSYSILLNDGNYQLTPNNPNPTYFSINPSSTSVSFPSASSPVQLDYCVAKNGVFPDLDVKIIPLLESRPGFDLTLKIIVTNTGTETLGNNGSIVFNYDDLVMDFVSAPNHINTPAGIVVWNFPDLLPFNSMEYEVTLNLNTPTETPPLNQGDMLTFTVVADDESTNNKDANTSADVEVVNAYDPNDKTCLQGVEVEPNIIGEYVDYLIRFENLGNADAINVVVKDVIDTSKFDISTLTPISSSHTMRTEIKNGNEVEFIFENINLPPSPPSNRVIGYLLFKVKTLSSLVVGDIFDNQADIFFDFNPAVITNNFETEITQEVLGTIDPALKSDLKIIPNPATDFIQIKTEETIKNVQFFDANGRLVQTSLNPEESIDIQRLTQGIYMVQIRFDNGEVLNKKLIVKD